MPLTGNYFYEHPTGGHIVPTGKRPTNQSHASVIRRSAKVQHDKISPKNRPKSVQRFIDELKKGVPLSRMNGRKGVDMSHVISAREIATILSKADAEIRRITSATKRAKRAEENENAMTEFISSDEEDDNVRVFRRDIREMYSKKSGSIRVNAANRVLRRLNRTSRNLMGGDASRNRGIQQHRDIPVLRDKRVPPYIQKRIRIADIFHGGASRVPPEYQPIVEPSGEWRSSTT